MAVKKVTINLPDEQVEFLQTLATNEHITFTDALRRAINSEKFFVTHEKAGHKILIEEDGQRIKEVVRK